MPIMPAVEIQAQQISWLWPQRIPLGKLVLLEGDPDLGKSLVSLDLCARLSTGRPFADGQGGGEPANALVLSGEDAAADTIVPRLKRLGADLQRVFVWQRHEEPEDWPWRFPGQAARLDDALERTQARLAIIDPLMAFLDESVIWTSDPSVRRALTPLMHLAEKYQCTLLLHRHLNKQGGGQALYRGLGSIAFMAACRFAMLVARDPKRPKQCVLAQVRHSMAKPQPSLRYRIQSSTGEAPKIEWLGTSPVSSDELLAGASKGGRRDQAAAFLEHSLAAGPRRARDIWAAAKKARLAFRTVQRAKRDLGVRCQRVSCNGRPVSYWLLDDQELGPGQYDDYEIDRLLGELKKPMRPRTPTGDEEYEEERY